MRHLSSVPHPNRTSLTNATTDRNIFYKKSRNVIITQSQPPYPVSLIAVQKPALRPVKAAQSSGAKWRTLVGPRDSSRLHTGANFLGPSPTSTGGLVVQPRELSCSMGTLYITPCEANDPHNRKHVHWPPTKTESLRKASFPESGQSGEFSSEVQQAMRREELQKVITVP